MMTSPNRLRKEPSLPNALRDALQELPNTDPSAAQLEQLRSRLGLGKGRGVAGAVAKPTLVRVTLGRQLARKLRRITPLFGFWPVAAAATFGVGAGVVFELRQHAAPPPFEAAPRSRATLVPHLALPVAPSPTARVATSEPSASPPLAAPSLPTTAVVKLAAGSAVVRAQPESAPPESTAVPSAAFAPAGSAAPDAPDAPNAPNATAQSELGLLQSANAALKSDPAKALRLAAEHRQLFPAGNLTQERDVIAIKAQVLLGKVELAQRSLAAFELAYPHSAHTLELRQIVP